jgi:glycosyltransferase involved in cell wall biosynthesis
VPELITDGHDGFLEAVGDVPAQAARVNQILEDESLHARLSTAARKTAIDRFSTESLIPQYERYYREVCARHT